MRTSRAAASRPGSCSSGLLPRPSPSSATRSGHGRWPPAPTSRWSPAPRARPDRAEDPRSLLPNPGPIDELAMPWRVGLRFDCGDEAGDEVGPQYDGLIGKLIAWAPTRDVALRRLADAVGALTIRGVDTTAS
ncbi:MAG: hypothetical protein GEV08_25335, partial [Acidimicrobiia bacterium]|nr:hypothetical protein [Acidimicrobiia bacterium]